MNTTLAIAAIISTLIALATLICVIIIGRKQIDKIADQTELLRKQIFGEVYEKAQIRDLRFYLPEKRKHPVASFESLQEEKKEVNLDKKSRNKERQRHRAPCPVLDGCSTKTQGNQLGIRRRRGT